MLVEGAVSVGNDVDEVFINPSQVFNRDLSIIAIKAFARRKRKEIHASVKCAEEKAAKENRTPPEPFRFRGLTILEPLAATGLRSLRYSLELPPKDVCHVMCGDIDHDAVSAIKANQLSNEVSRDKFSVICTDAVSLMNATTMPRLVHQHSGPAECQGDCVITVADGACPPKRKLVAGCQAPITWPEDSETTSRHALCSDAYPFGCPFDVIDLDPYGSVAEFIDSAVRNVKHGGLVCLTSTDMMTLCGKDPGVTFYKYGGSAVKSRAIHEVSLRLLLNAVVMSAARYRRIAVPLLSCSVDFYIRLFVEIRDTPLMCKGIATQTSLLLQCQGCDFFVLAPFAQTYPSKSARQDLKSNGGDTVSTAAPASAPSTELDTATRIKIATVPELSSGSKCAECGGRLWMGGPIYSGPLYNKEFVNFCLEECEHASTKSVDGNDTGDVTFNPLLLRDADTSPVQASECRSMPADGASGGGGVSVVCTSNDDPQLMWRRPSAPLRHIRMTTKIRGFLTAVTEELHDVPLYYHLPTMCHNFSMQMMKPSLVKASLIHLGYRVSHFHREPQALKTDAPNSVVFDILRDWIKTLKEEERPRKHKELWDRPSRLPVEINFESVWAEYRHAKAAEVASHLNSVPRWLPNPEPNWGPAKRAKRRGHQAASDSGRPKKNKSTSDNPQ